METAAMNAVLPTQTEQAVIDPVLLFWFQMNSLMVRLQMTTQSAPSD